MPHSPQFVLNFATGSVSFPLSVAGASSLQTELEALITDLKTVAAGSQSKGPVRSTDVLHKEEGLRLELFCNPNIWPSPHAAKVLVTLKADSLRFSTEVELPRLLEDLGQHLATV
jgi:hypothetical protein